MDHVRGAVRRWVASGESTTSRFGTTAAFVPLLLIFVLATFLLPRRASDERNYVELAHNLLDGHFAGLGWRPATPYGTSADPANPDLWFGPGLPAALTPLVALDLPIEVLRLTGALFMFGAVLVFYGLLRLHVGRGTALVGAYALGAYFPSYLLFPTIHSEPLAILLLVSMLYLLSRYLAGGRHAYGVAAAAAAAGVALTRVAYGWVLTGMVVAFGLWWLVSRRRTALRVVGVYALALGFCLPWLAFTYSVTDRLFVWGNSGSLSLYWMSSPHPEDLGNWRGGAYEVVVTDPKLAHHRDFFLELAPLDPAEQNRRLERRAIENIRGSPVKFAENVAANVSRMFFGFPYSAKPETLNTLFYLVPNSIVLWAVVGCAFLVARQPGSFPPEGVAFAAFAGFGFALHAVLAAFPRMLMPLIPIALWFVFHTVGTVVVPYLTRTSGTYDASGGATPTSTPSR
jgi:4-amino-4-deoxy-L-arabinose transferase-like glycosyltransferase